MSLSLGVQVDSTDRELAVLPSDVEVGLHLASCVQQSRGSRGYIATEVEDDAVAEGIATLEKSKMARESQVLRLTCFVRATR